MTAPIQQAASVVETPRAAGSTKKRLLLRLGVLGLSAVLAAATVAFATRRPPRPLPTLGEVPAFSMRDQRARTVTADSLRGTVNIVDFFFTSCPSSCPRLMARMADVEKMLAAKGSNRDQLGVRLVSISVDPENDTPAKLAEYSALYHADPEHWWYLTGDVNALEKIVVDGFKVHYQKADPSIGIGEIMHGNWFVLVDARGKIRGYYLSDDPKRITELVDDAVRLATHPG